MTVQVFRFLSLLFVALVLAPSMAHLLELPDKIGLVATQAIFWIFTYPANVATQNWTTLPDNWMGPACNGSIRMRPALS